MHVESGESGLHSFVTRAALFLLACCAASCVSEPTRRAPPATPAAADAEPAAVEPQAEDRAEQEAEQQSGSDAASAEPEPAPEPADETRASESAKNADTARPGWVHGSLGVRYRGRATSDDQDHELRTVLTLDVADPRAPWISGHLLARADADLDGLDESSVFEDLSDTYDGSVVAKLYLAYADVVLGDGPDQGPGTLRIGRQSDARLPEVLRLDGLTYLSRPLGEREVELGVYAGVPVHLYESSAEGDRAYGTFVEGRAWRDGWARFDWMHLEDEQLLGEERDDLLALSLWHRLAPSLRLEGELTRLESDPRDLRLRALYQDPEGVNVARVTYHELQSTQKFRVQELDPFTEQLLELFPFREGNLNLSRAFGEHAVLDVGFDLRRVSDPDDVGEFNRDWERYYAAATWHDAVVAGLGLSLTGDRWDDDDRDTSALGADLSYDQEAWRAALGSYYSLYKYELLELSEREDVRTYYVRVDRELSARLRLDVLYEYEDDDLDTYHTLRLGVLWRF